MANACAFVMCLSPLYVWLMNMRGSTSLSFRLLLGTTTPLALADSTSDRLLGFSGLFNITQSSTVGLQSLPAADDVCASQQWCLDPQHPDCIMASVQRATKANKPSSLLEITSAWEYSPLCSTSCTLASLKANTSESSRMETAQRDCARSMHTWFCDHLTNAECECDCECQCECQCECE